jgi:integrase/recombinase XerD
MNINKYQLWLKEQNITPGTIRNYSWTIKQYGTQPLTTSQISQFLQANSLKYQAWTIRNQSKALKSYAQFKKKWVDWKVVKRVIPTILPKFYTTINSQELERLKEVKWKANKGQQDSQRINERNNLLLDFLFYSGVRVKELVNIKHCDWTGNSLKVWGKGNKVRQVFLPPFLSKIFNSQREDYLFRTRSGKPLSPVQIRTILKRKVEQAGIGKVVTPHTFRRSFATLLNNKGARLTTIQKLLGHSSIETTTSYIHNSWEELYGDYSRLWEPSKDTEWKEVLKKPTTSSHD